MAQSIGISKMHAGCSLSCSGCEVSALILIGLYLNGEVAIICVIHLLPFMQGVVHMK